MTAQIRGQLLFDPFRCGIRLHKAVAEQITGSLGIGSMALENEFHGGADCREP